MSLQMSQPAGEDDLALPLAGDSPRYWQLWKRGWWLQLLMMAFNFVAVVLVAPLGLISTVGSGLHLLFAVVVWVVVAIPIGGWLYNRFASATHRGSDTSDGALR